MSTWFSRLCGAVGMARSEDVVASGRVAHVPAAPPALAPDVEIAFLRWLVDADPHADREPDASERDLVQALDAALGDARLASRVPRVPAIVPQLLQMMRDPSRSASDVARHVAHDPVLVASILRAANSPYYGAGRRIDGIDQAVLVLGHDGLRQLVAAVALKPLVNVQSGRFTRPGAPRLWQQSEMAGAACRTLAPTLGGGAFEAYLAVLLLNMGTIVALRILDERCGPGPGPGSRAFCTAFADAVQQLGRSIGRQWEFPSGVCAACACDAATPTAVLVRAAEHVSRLRALADGGRISADDAALFLGAGAAFAACFAALGRTAGGEA